MSRTDREIKWIALACGGLAEAAWLGPLFVWAYDMGGLEGVAFGPTGTGVVVVAAMVLVAVAMAVLFFAHRVQRSILLGFLVLLSAANAGVAVIALTKVGFILSLIGCVSAGYLTVCIVRFSSRPRTNNPDQEKKWTKN